MPGRGRPIRVVVVDDSSLMRAMIRSALSGDGDIEVVGLAAHVGEGREMIRNLDPDVITLDVEMPGMNGLDFLEKIMTLRPTPVVMVSSLTARGTETALEALSIGAVDAIAKPDSPQATAAWGPLLRSVVRVAAAAKVQRRAVRAPAPAAVAAVAARRPAVTAAPTGRRMVAIGASTGGVGALGQLFQALGRRCSLPILITQHMPAGYTERFAGRLAAETGLDVAEGRDGEPLRAGMIRIAPGDRHMTVTRSGAGLIVQVGGTDPVSGHCPSVDRLFHSVAQSAGEQALGVILTGMGRDGADGMLAMRQAGARCLGQSPESCVVYGMPKAAMQLGAVNEELNIPALAERIAAQGSAGSARQAM
ncbi:chemotaxis response regulator protein-glutamate methylesterase [Oceanicella sp. SM1341]|uniref:protein-glutamate methylesterase/protein-glutamine glutaminase n=1 Tax=Oceanicella sp. SM1341 TaxID=1548889 RepID=UPI000E534303|nr:chemotaxis response regulator protein-glutamate methylesterase [Oceanicella sp. SM1341]